MKKIWLLLLLFLPFALIAEEISIVIVARTEVMQKESNSNSLYNQLAKILKKHDMEIINTKEAENSNSLALINNLK